MNNDSSQVFQFFFNLRFQSLRWVISGYPIENLEFCGANSPASPIELFSGFLMNKIRQPVGGAGLAQFEQGLLFNLTDPFPGQAEPVANSL
jgi:hypothetical protein